MAATSNRNTSATKQAAPATGGTSAGLTPIWIRLPRIGDADLAGDESLDGDETARSSAQNRSAGPADASRAAGSRRDHVASSAASARTAAPEPFEEDEALEEAPAYLRELAERQRAAAFASDKATEEEAPAPRSSRSQGKRRSAKPETKPSGSFVTHLFRAPYNVLAGVAIVAASVGLYVCFKPDTASTDAILDIEAGPSLTLDMGQLSSPPEPYASAPEAVDPATLYPGMSLPSDGGFRPADPGPSISGIASADYGTATTTSPPFGAAVPPGAATSGTPAINASSSVSATVDPALSGLPVETYPETDPATYRYPADAAFDVPSDTERVAEGVSAAPRAASLGDTLEKTPVR
ncbi:MAG TPA: hypothetical protein VGN57_14210 [Pirellulaceae bacterium]|jgi:hypothetical protein|nr:hypothetical protein [Pirellulaceae bacterium]